tara:strand:+ start:451 stop:1257 length:807 start_codon:yes stop_codon:yes gene_type:complete
MFNDVLRGPVANVLVLHYIKPEETNFEGWFSFAENWLLKHGLTPTKMSGKGDSNITFSRGKKTLIKENYQRMREEGLTILALPPDEKVSTEAFDFIMASHLDMDKNYKGTACTFCWGDQVVPWGSTYIKTLVKDLLNFIKPAYGYAFQREFKKGPIFYPAGIESGKISDQEGAELRNWRVTGRSPDDDPDYQPHMIRDVYPLNFLSPQHLKAPVGDQTLEQWIKSDSTRGTLEEILPDFWCWSVDPQNIEPVKESLKPHNLLIAHMTF